MTGPFINNCVVGKLVRSGWEVGEKWLGSGWEVGEMYFILVGFNKP